MEIKTPLNLLVRMVPVVTLATPIAKEGVEASSRRGIVKLEEPQMPLKQQELVFTCLKILLPLLLSEVILQCIE